MSDFQLTSSDSQILNVDPAILQLDQLQSPTFSLPPENSLSSASMEWTHDDSPQPAFSGINRPMPDSTQSEFPSPLTYPFDLSLEERAQSQPPPDIVFHRSIHHSRHRNPRTSAHNRHLRALSNSLHRGASRTSSLQRTHSPTSVPSAEFQTTRHESEDFSAGWREPEEEAHVMPLRAMVAAQESNASVPIDDNFPIPQPQQQHTSMSLYIEARLSQLQQAVSSMQRYLSQSYISPDDDRVRQDVEQSRLSSRAYNRNLTELTEALLSLPRHSGAMGADIPIPETGQDLRNLNHPAVDALLDSYDIAFSPTMFLWEKKALYLRFIGAGRALMHRVLD